MDILRQSTRRALDRSVALGEIERISRGRYALAALPPGLKTADALRGTLSHASAAQYWKLEAVCEPSSVHVTVPRSGHRNPPRSVTLHYSDPGADRVTGPLRTVLDCARTLPFREGLAIADSALRRRLIDRGELVAAADLLAGPGSLRARTVAAAADGRSANPFESALRATLVEARIDGFEPQLPITGGTRWVDLGDPTRRMAIEADSFAFHGSRDALERDCRRYDELVSHGWLVLRFSWEQVMFDEPWVRRMVMACCQLRADQRGGSISACVELCARRVA